MSNSRKQMSLFEQVIYHDADTDVALSLDTIHETVWASLDEMSKLFGRDTTAIGRHVRSIFSEGECDEVTCAAKFAVDVGDGRTYRVLHYNLDVVLSVGYRVSSKKAAAFRRWANGVLRDYVLQGYAINEDVVGESPSALKKLAAEVRRMRTSEKNIYQSVRDVFAKSSVDYEKNSPSTRHFFSNLQDKFIFAINGHVSADMVLRADHTKELMGLRATKSGNPTVADATVGKNYLDSDELYQLHILCEQFLLAMESNALREIPLTMLDITRMFDELLKATGHQVFTGYTQAKRKNAEAHARRELDTYKQRMKLLKKVS